MVSLVLSTSTKHPGHSFVDCMNMYSMNNLTTSQLAKYSKPLLNTESLESLPSAKLPNDLVVSWVES